MPGGRNGKGTGVWATPFRCVAFSPTPLCTELSTFTHGRRLPYEADYFTRHCPPEYPPAPCPLARRNRQDAPTGPEPEAHTLSGCGNCGGCGKCSMKKSKPEPIPVMDYRQYRRSAAAGT